MDVNRVQAKSILNATGGFLAAYTHTINPYHGCQLGLGLCGNYCYARAIAKGIKGETRTWGTYLDAKVNAAELYRTDYERIRKSGKELRIFMSSVTDPYVPVENSLMITRGLLEAMTEMPPDALAVQTHTPNLLHDLDLFNIISTRCSLSLQVTVETDMENDELDKLDTKINFRHVYPVKARMEALRKIKDQGLQAVAVVSPLLPLKDPEGFASMIKSCSNYVILDHFLLGDGSKGKRTASPLYFQEPLPHVLQKNGYEEWNRLEMFDRIVNLFKDVMGEDRVGVSREGFAHAAKRKLNVH